MKKQHLFLVAAIILFGAIVYFYYSQTIPKNVAETNLPVTDAQLKNTAEINPPATTTSAIATDPLLGIDYSSLEKDRLYSEEEGAYENLSDTGKKLLRAILAHPECVVNPHNTNCDGDENNIEHSIIVSLKGGYLMLKANGHIEGPRAIIIYDLKKRQRLEKDYYDYYGYDGIKTKEQKVVLTLNSGNLLYYKPGMSDFSKIPNSQLKGGEGYLDSDGLGGGNGHGEIIENKLIIFVYGEALPPPDESSFKKIREVTFDLSTLK